MSGEDKTPSVAGYNPGPTLFGRRLASIPCYRETILYSAGAMTSTILLTFLFTSKMPLAVRYGSYAFASVALVYWPCCRHQYSRLKENRKMLEQYLQGNDLHEGSEDTNS